MNDDRRADLLVSRAVDGDATSSEWDELSGLADGEPALWRCVALTLRDRGGVGRAVGAAAAIADLVELPAGHAVAAAGARAASASTPRLRWRLPNVRPALLGGGWAVAALVALAWGLTIVAARTAPVTPPSPRDVAQSNGGMLDRPPRKEDLAQFPPDDLLAAYIANGKRDNLVVGELPEKVLVDSRSAPSGHGYEVLFVRPILERTVVPDLYEFGGRDEAGRPTAVPVRYDGSGPPR